MVSRLKPEFVLFYIFVLFASVALCLFHCLGLSCFFFCHFHAHVSRPIASRKLCFGELCTLCFCVSVFVSAALEQKCQLYLYRVLCCTLLKRPSLARFVCLVFCLFLLLGLKEYCCTVRILSIYINKKRSFTPFRVPPPPPL
jgi:hypothetical protein